MRRIFWYWSLVLLCLFGCEDMTKKSPNSIIGKKTQDVGEYKPEAGAKVSQGNLPYDGPVSGAMNVLANTMERVPKLQIQSAVEIFKANEDRYPNSHEEFMTRIIKENNIQLPVLPAGKKFQYDVANHELVVVEPPTEGEAPATP